ncbi:MAG TPA: type IV pili twitching motility protein PilT, partial [Actinomycetota bacterium]|nr:type IV pili twitching motility protein PilT [Actinomycetota bacterium]
MIRIDGQLQPLEGDRLTPDDTRELAHSIIPPDRRDRLEKQKEADFAYTVSGVGRFRANAYHQRGSISVVLRRVRVGSPTYEELGLPPVVAQLAEAPRGLVLVTGPT